MCPQKYSVELSTLNKLLIKKVINDLKESFKADQTHDPEPTLVSQYTPKPCRTSSIVDRK